MNPKVMNPKAKAKALMNAYIEIMPCLANQTGRKIIENAKKCSIVLCNEIIIAITEKENFLYWQEVKKELIIL